MHQVWYTFIQVVLFLSLLLVYIYQHQVDIYTPNVAHRNASFEQFHVNGFPLKNLSFSIFFNQLRMSLFIGLIRKLIFVFGRFNQFNQSMHSIGEETVFFFLTFHVTFVAKINLRMRWFSRDYFHMTSLKINVLVFLLAWRMLKENRKLFSIHTWSWLWLSNNSQLKVSGAQIPCASKINKTNQ